MVDSQPTHDDVSSTTDPQRWSRRSCLSGIAAGVTLLAGCLSGSEDDDRDGETAAEEVPDGVDTDDLPEYSVDEDAQPTPMVLEAETLATDVEFLDEFPVELAVANVGGVDLTAQSIEVGLEYADTSNAFGGVNEPDPVTVDLPEIESGEWETVEVELRVNVEGTWTLVTDARTHPSFEHAIDAESKRLTPGDAIASDVGEFEITALEPAYERALHYDTEEGGVGLFTREATGLLAADDDEVLLLHRFTVENTSDDRSIGFGTVFVDNQFAHATLAADPGDLVTEDDMRDSIDTLALPTGDAVFGNNAIDPGETAELVAVQSVPVEDAPNASLTLSLGGDGDDVVFESSGDAPALPAFELVDATVTDGDGEDPVIEMTVENSGDAAGTFRGGAQFHASRPTAPDWVYLPDGVETTLEPGERDTLEITASRGDDAFRVLPFETEVER